ncbi:hypothetical protein [Azospirillum brasilense]|uniref:hypothetical protein n=1 Tax=Azospirillum brasilense TaxID=192 RepID=UPI000E69746B|nr:hypothetical protein [Azospirillum brasilense]NUB26251.1 hypothetical protein [Azospirillum brasilense]NUB34237.1 hypothetical protein [Azospirillum brasilense]RIV99237.1 hypothetical protein D2T81_23875 [Azospirillum brasilense]
MGSSYTVTESDETAYGSLILLHGKVLLITGISSDHPTEHNRLARLMVGVLERLTPTEQAELDRIVGAHEDRWSQEARKQ